MKTYLTLFFTIPLQEGRLDLDLYAQGRDWEVYFTDQTEKKNVVIPISEGLTVKSVVFKPLWHTEVLICLCQILTDIWEKYLNLQKEIKIYNHKSGFWENRGRNCKKRSKFRHDGI